MTCRQSNPFQELNLLFGDAHIIHMGTVFVYAAYRFASEYNLRLSHEKPIWWTRCARRIYIVCCCVYTFIATVYNNRFKWMIKEKTPKMLCVPWEREQRGGGGDWEAKSIDLCRWRPENNTFQFPLLVVGSSRFGFSLIFVAEQKLSFPSSIMTKWMIF